MKRFYQLKMARQLDRPSPPALVSKPPFQLDGPDTATNRAEE
jgi:hypothetical protein